MNYTISRYFTLLGEPQSFYLTFLDNGLSPRSSFLVVMRITRFVQGSLADFPICHVVTPVGRGKEPLSTQTVSGKAQLQNVIPCVWTKRLGSFYRCSFRGWYVGMIHVLGHGMTNKISQYHVFFRAEIEPTFFDDLLFFLEQFFLNRAVCRPEILNR